MTVIINYKNTKHSSTSGNLVFFVDEKFNISGLKKYISNSEFLYISDLLKDSDLKKDLLVFEINSKKTIFLASIKKDIQASNIENLGAKFHGYMNYDKKKDYIINTDTISESFTLGSNQNAMVAGPVNITGDLIINGTFTVV